jgi:hypothetical protein
MGKAVAWCAYCHKAIAHYFELFDHVTCESPKPTPPRRPVSAIDLPDYQPPKPKRGQWDGMRNLYTQLARARGRRR